MHISFRQADFETLTSVWNDFYPDQYRIDADLLRQNSVESPVFDWGASQIAVRDDETLGFVLVKSSADRLYGRRPSDSAHLSALAFTDVDAGIDLLAEVKTLLRNLFIALLGLATGMLENKGIWLPVVALPVVI